MADFESKIIINSEELYTIKKSLDMTCKRLLEIDCQELVGEYAYLEKSIEYLWINLGHSKAIEFSIVDRKIKNINLIKVSNG